MNHSIPGESDKLQTKIESRFGVLPNFFQLALINQEVTATLH